MGESNEKIHEFIMITEKMTTNEQQFGSYFSTASITLYKILAMGGYFLIHESSIDDLDVHDESDIDGIVDAMEWQEHRIAFQNAILKLANTFLEEDKDDDLPANPDDEICFFESVEEATFQLNNIMETYHEGIDQQRSILIKSIEDFRILVKEYNFSSTNNSAKNELVQSLFLAQVLADQYRRQLDLENFIIIDMMKFISEKLYNDYEEHLQQEQQKMKGTGNVDIFSPLKSTITPSEKMKTKKSLFLRNCISSLKERRMLEKKIWLTKSRLMLKLISRYYQNKSNDFLSAYETNSHNDINMDFTFQENVKIQVKKVPTDLLTLTDKLSSCKNINEVIDYFVKHENFPHPHSYSDKVELFNSSEHFSHYDNKMNYCNETILHSTFILVSGSLGTGKTHFIDSLHQRMLENIHNSTKMDQHKIQVVRPRLPVDILRNTVGSSEDLLISMFNYAKYSALKTGKCLILLDDLEHIVGHDDSEFPSSIRNPKPRSLLQSLFTVIMDDLKRKSFTKKSIGSFQSANIMVICTVKKLNNDLLARFDKVFTLGKLNNLECKQLIENCFSKQSNGSEECTNLYEDKAFSTYQEQSVNQLLQAIIKHTAGRSIGEISKFCRNVLASECNESIIQSNDKLSLFKRRLEKLKIIIHETNPESIKNGSISDVVDINILTLKELHSNPLYINDTETGTRTFKLPLIGQNAESSWKEMENLIIVPLCRSKELNDLLFGDRSSEVEINGGSSSNVRSSKTVCAGVLLTGQPGCGKTALAYHCAAVAASINNSIRLLDVSCTSLVKKEVGGSEKAVRSLFEAARAAAPCIILLDGIENIAPVRGNDNTTEGTMDRVLSTLLTEMDGLDNYSGGDNESRSEEGSIAVIGITHNPDWLDHALRRPGRLEKCIKLELPDLKSREKIILQKIEGNKVDFSDAQFFDPKNKRELAAALAMRTHGNSAADLIALCNDAVMLSVAKKLQKHDFGSDNDWDEQYASKLPILSYKYYFSSIKHLRAK